MSEPCRRHGAQAPVRRVSILAVIAGCAVALALASFAGLPKRFFLNTSASAPLGLYAIDDGKPAKGDFVLAHLPDGPQALVETRGYLPAGVPVIKRIAAVPGDEVCRIGRAVYVEGQRVATALAADSKGRPMPVWSGCRRLVRGELFLLNDDPRSFDGRYFGPVRRSTGIARLQPLWVRSGGGAVESERPARAR